MKSAWYAAYGCAAVAIGFSSLTPARADVVVVQQTVIDCPGLKQMLKEIPEEQRGPLLGMMSPMLTGTPWITTTYVKGDRMREDMGQTTVVVNAESGKSFTLNRQTMAYSIGPYDPFQQAAGGVTCRITPSHETHSLLGYRLQAYNVEMTSSVLPKSQIDGQIWAAPDLPTPPSAGYSGGPAAAVQDQMDKIKGMPLAYTIIYHDTPAGDIKIESYATSIKENDLSATTFEIPSEFHKGQTRMAMKTPSSGFPLGDGMPLDSMNPVTSAMATGDAADGAGMMGGAGGGDASQMLSNMSPQEMQALMSMAQGMGGGMGGSGGGGADGLSGMSPAQLQQMLSALGGGGSSGGGGDAGGMSSMINPQMLQQLNGEMQSLLNDDN